MERGSGCCDYLELQTGHSASDPIADSRVIAHMSAMSSDCCSSKGTELEKLARQADQRRVLIVVLLINAAMFFVEFGAGVVAGSTALMADATDMLGDALVYGVSLYALSRGDRWKAGAAVFKGVLILLLGSSILVNVGIKITTGVPPSSTLMLIFGGIALVANLVCLALLWRFRQQDVNMASTFECSRNDVISNVGVLIAAGAVAGLASPWPDILIGGVMAAIILRSSVKVLKEALPKLSADKANVS